jgi:AcrR family transcriptional regulator
MSLAIHRLEPQSARGRARVAKILEAATQLFLKVGYEQASIDSILLQSGGSKSTLYAYFPTKEDLFRSVIDKVVDNDVGAALDVRGNARVVLTGFAVQRLRAVLAPRHRAVLGVVIAERERFPDLARIYCERGPRKSQLQLAAYLEMLRRHEVLSIDDAAEAADLFIGMLFQRWHQQLFYVALPPPSEALVRAHAERVVTRFFAAYRSGAH